MPAAVLSTLLKARVRSIELLEEFETARPCSHLLLLDDGPWFGNGVSKLGCDDLQLRSTSRCLARSRKVGLGAQSRRIKWGALDWLGRAARMLTKARSLCNAGPCV